MRRSAFTLMELMVVMVVISILLALLIPAVGLVKGRMRISSATSQLAQIKAGLDQYRDLNGLFPEAGMTDVPTANLNQLRSMLISVNADAFTARPGSPDPFRDPWAKFFQYRPAKTYPFDNSAPKTSIDGTEPPGADSYQLWSLGPNSIDDSSNRHPTFGDDITSWKR